MLAQHFDYSNKRTLFLRNEKLGPSTSSKIMNFVDAA